MIQDFHVSNFFSIREQQGISFIPSSDERMLEQYTYEVKPGVRLLKVGIVYGANASGKSTLLQSVDFFRYLMTNRPSAKTEDMGFLPFMLDDYSRNEHSQMQMTFFLNEERYILSIEFDAQRIYEEQLVVYSSVRPTSLYKRKYNADSDHTTVEFGTKVGLSKKSQQTIAGNTINNCSVMAAFGQSNVEASRLNLVYEFFAVGMQNMLSPRMDMLDFVKSALRDDTDNDLKKFLLKVLGASDFNIVDLALDSITHDELNFSHYGENGNYVLSEIVESQGTKRFLGMAAMLHILLKNKCFIPIDEVETSVHYELLSYFIKLFLVNSEGSSQLLMTTHDINLLNEDFIRRDVIWFTDKDKSGATTIKRLSALGLHKTLSPYNAYKQGKLVKLPFLGSIYLDI